MHTYLRYFALSLTLSRWQRDSVYAGRCCSVPISWRAVTVGMRTQPSCWDWDWESAGAGYALRWMSQADHRPLLAESDRRVLARGLPQMFVLRMPTRWGRVVAVRQGRSPALPQRLPTVWRRQISLSALFVKYPVRCPELHIIVILVKVCTLPD